MDEAPDREDSARALAALMAAYQGGDEMAFERLYEELSGPVRAFLHSLTRNPVRADDLLQETFFHVHRARQTYDPGRSAKAWIYAIAHNVFLMSCRSEKRRSRHEELADDELPDVPVPAEAESFATKDAVRKALGRLSVDRREAVILHHVQGLSFQEVGTVLGITTMAAKLRSHRAMAELRGILKEGTSP
ncbi:MAG: RNA polymerase sigma factor [Holophagales bacterium]|nr:RNA polymerase sigma factor [Holophagales bacterium]MBK9967638.1 RNA polymerase sigma factor [Holophagales bacterium]